MRYADKTTNIIYNFDLYLQVHYNGDALFSLTRMNGAQDSITFKTAAEARKVYNALQNEAQTEFEKLSS